MRFLASGAAAALVLTASASAQYSEGFESYANGSPIEGQGGWKNWDTCATGNRTYNRVVDAQASSGSQSLRMIGSMDPVNGNFASDTVYELNNPNFTTGVWEFTCQTYIPSGFFGEAWVIILNDFSDCGGPYNWSFQLQFNAASLNVQPIVPFGSSAGQFVDLTGNSGATPYITDQWVEIKAIIDLDNDIVTASYGGTDLFSHAWLESFGAGSSQNISTIDLFCGTNDTTEWYIDDISITAGPGGPPGANYCNAQANSTGGAASIDVTGSNVAADNDITLMASGMPPQQFGIFLTSMTQASTPVASGTLCVGGNIIRFQGPGQILQASPAGEYSLAIDISALPAGVPTPIVAGDTYNFTTWFRDIDPAIGNTANFSDGYSITFQ